MFLRIGYERYVEEERDMSVMYRLYFIGVVAAFVYFGSYTDFFEVIFEMEQTIGETITPWLLTIIIAILLFKKR